jgi:predicted amidohydrolase YtcJ
MNLPFLTIDLIIHNARIFDPLKGFIQPTALATSSGRILALGSDQEILSLQNASSQVINAGGKLLLPAFTDSHTHYWKYVQRQMEVNLEDCHSLQETLSRIRKKVQESPAGSWITGGGWDYNLWPAGEFPHRLQLDEISTRHFIALDSKDWHTCWVNSPVLKQVGIALDKPYPGAKQLALHPVTGEFTGLLEEQVRLAVFDLLPKWDYTRLRSSYPKVLKQFYRCGITAVHSMETPAEFRISQEARIRNQLGIRIFWYFPYQLIDHAKALAIGEGIGDDFIRICGVKMFVDGAFGSQSAELLENYDQLGHAGTEVMTESELREAVAAANTSRLSCAIHAIGDRAVQKTLRVLGQFHLQSRQYGLRHRIEHAQLIQSQDIPLFKKHQIYASLQPVHLAYDIPVIEKYLSNRAQLTYPFGDLKKQGATLLFGSDIPVEDFNPWLAIYTATERKYLFRLEEPSFFPEQKLDLLTCLQAYTINPAEVVGMAHCLGRISEGMLADFFLCNQNIFNVPSEQIKETCSVLTVIAGKIVYQNFGGK